MASVPVYAYILVVAATILWFLPFALARWNRKSPQIQDRRARWGMLLEVVGYTLVWQGHFWLRPLLVCRLAVSIFFFVLASVLSWKSARALGRHLRIDAALDADHELVRTGPYRYVRHPIYASFLCLLLGTAIIIAPPLLFVLGLVIFLAGTEMRVRIEDGLLAAHFGDQFRDYRHSTRAYIPFVR
jgi:protein-S-isoprenylcysteine O-methyltransferase Ste14